MPDTTPSNPRRINPTVFFTELMLCLVVIGDLLVSWNGVEEWDGLSAVPFVWYGGFPALVLMGCLARHLLAPKLGVGAKANVYRSWLLLPLPAWLFFVLDDLHRHPDALGGVSFVCAGLLASVIWIILASLPLAFNFFREDKKTPEE